jgi:hypothetical protein
LDVEINVLTFLVRRWISKLGHVEETIWKGGRAMEKTEKKGEWKVENKRVKYIHQGKYLDIQGNG